MLLCRDITNDLENYTKHLEAVFNLTPITTELLPAKKFQLTFEILLESGTNK